MRPTVSLGLVLLGGCALLGKGEARVSRYYSAETTPPAASSPVPGTGLTLRLGRVTAAPYLRERMVVGNSEHEITYREDRRWTERPERYLERALSRALFAQRGLVHVLSGEAPTLDVTLDTFMELASQPRRVRLQVTFVLQHERIAKLERTITVDRPLRETGVEDEGLAVAEALSLALSEAVATIADGVTGELAAMDASSPPIAGAQ